MSDEPTNEAIALDDVREELAEVRAAMNRISGCLMTGPLAQMLEQLVRIQQGMLDDARGILPPDWGAVTTGQRSQLVWFVGPPRAAGQYLAWFDGQITPCCYSHKLKWCQPTGLKMRTAPSCWAHIPAMPDVAKLANEPERTKTDSAKAGD